MTTGEGGMVVTNDDMLADKLRVLRSHGMTSLSWDRHKGHAWTYDVVDLGYNYRIDEIRSAIGRQQLKKVGGFNQRRESLTHLYRELLSELAPEILVPFQAKRGKPCHHIMPVLLPHGMNRFDFMEGMKGEGIQTSIHYPPIHRFKNYEEWPAAVKTDLSVTENVATREITLPLYPAMKTQDVEIVVTAIQNQIARLK
jgi:dTDP-4-amino-4,6-dideoxygalactose transaminase